MTRKSPRYAAAGLVLIMAILAAALTEVSAQECSIITLTSTPEQNKITAEPAKTQIAKGDCVVMFNRANAADIRVSFVEGQKCSLATRATVNFNMDANLCFVSAWMPVGGTSSLSFKEKGTYKYIVEMAPAGAGPSTEKGKMVAEGEVVVSE